MNNRTLTLLAIALAIVGGNLVATRIVTRKAAPTSTPQATAAQTVADELPEQATIVLPQKITVVNNLPAQRDGTSAPVTVYQTKNGVTSQYGNKRLFNNPTRLFSNAQDNQIEITVEPNTTYAIAYSQGQGRTVYSTIPLCFDRYNVPADVVEDNTHATKAQNALRIKNDDCKKLIASKSAAAMQQEKVTAASQQVTVLP